MAGKMTPAAKRELNTALFEAVQNNDVAAVRRLIKQGADPDTMNRSDCYTPLNVAIEERHLEIVRVLLEAGATSVKGIVDNLEEAITDKNVELVKLLLSYGADPNGGAPASSRVTRPLMEAARVGSMKIVEVLLAAGADKTQQNENLRTAADIANENGFPKIVAKLSPPVAKRSKGKPAFDPAEVRKLKREIERGNVKAVAKLCVGKQLDQDFVSDLRTTPLIFAIWKKNLEVIQAIVEAGASLTFWAGEFPLEAAARGGSLDVMDLLVRLGADVNYRVPHGPTALTSAIEQEQVESVKWLMQHGADPHSKDYMGRTAWDIMLESEASAGKPSPCRPLLSPP